MWVGDFERENVSVGLGGTHVLLPRRGRRIGVKRFRVPFAKKDCLLITKQHKCPLCYKGSAASSGSVPVYSKREGKQTGVLSSFSAHQPLLAHEGIPPKEKHGATCKTQQTVVSLLYLAVLSEGRSDIAARCI
jgi:hypothetical protein